MTTAQPGQEQRMERARDMLMRRRKDAESLGGSAEIATEELDEAIAALTRPTADLGEAVARIEAAVDECSSDKASECLTADSFFQDAQTGRAIYVRDIRALLGHLTHRKADLGEDGERLPDVLRAIVAEWERGNHAAAVVLPDGPYGFRDSLNQAADRIELYRGALVNARDSVTRCEDSYAKHDALCYIDAVLSRSGG